MLSLYDIVKLKKDDASHGIKSSYSGTVIDVIGDGEAYTVEFVGDDLEFIEIYPTYTEDELILVKRVDL